MAEIFSRGQQGISSFVLQQKSPRSSDFGYTLPVRIEWQEPA
jgi:hypothetical protein